MPPDLHTKEKLRHLSPDPTPRRSGARRFAPTAPRELRTRMFLSHRLQNQADSDKILYLLSWIYLPQNFLNVFYLT